MIDFNNDHSKKFATGLYSAKQIVATFYKLDEQDRPRGASIRIEKVRFGRIIEFNVYNYVMPERTIDRRGYLINEKPFRDYDSALELAEKEVEAVMETGEWKINNKMAS